MVRGVGASLDAIDSNLELASRTLGADRIHTFFRITVPLMKSGMLSGSVLTFARSIGEFGASIMVSGNLVGQTQTGPLYIYSRFNTGDIEGAAAIAVILAAVSFVILFALKMFTGKNTEVA
jgi:molybdate transport system permease protein